MYVLHKNIIFNFYKTINKKKEINNHLQ